STLVRRPPLFTLFPYTTLFRSFLLLGVVALVAGLFIPVGRLGVLLRLFLGRLDFLLGLLPGRLGVLPGLLLRRLGVLELDVRHLDRKSTRLNSSHVKISYAVFC